ncbi:Tim10/DDP family zinc finger protein [Mycena sanguinolenta]|nr:Tim10/DDP family zinc finger protein [Mycena sanguinolenta]
MDFSGLSSAEQAHVNKLVEKRQFQGFLTMYGKLVEKCFNTCVNDFTSKSLSSKEEQCVNNCAEKFMKHSERVSARFAEMNAGPCISRSNPLFFSSVPIPCRNNGWPKECIRIESSSVAASSRQTGPRSS